MPFLFPLLTSALLALCTFTVGCTDGPPDEFVPGADDDDIVSALPSPPVAVATASPDVGAVPQQVQFSAASSFVPAGITSAWWAFDDGTWEVGETVQRTYAASGLYSATLMVTDARGRQDQAGVEVAINPGSCPGVEEATTGGSVAFEDIDEVSGLVHSHKNPGVLWVHNDSGDSARLFALNTEGGHLGVFTLDEGSSRDWEDMAGGRDPVTGEHRLYVGDIGDNGGSHATLFVHIVPEPVVAADQEPVEATLPHETLELDYPGKAAWDAESLMVDPVTDDIYIVTKLFSGHSLVFRKPAPHVGGETTELEMVAALDFSKAPLAGLLTTAADISPAGDRIIIRTYGRRAFIWLWDRAVDITDVFATAPCEIQLPQEPQAESVCFSADGAGLYTISEGHAQPIWYTPLVDIVEQHPVQERLHPPVPRPAE